MAERAVKGAASARTHLSEVVRLGDDYSEEHLRQSWRDQKEAQLDTTKTELGLEKLITPTQALQIQWRKLRAQIAHWL
jgi:hypothetical protein